MANTQIETFIRGVHSRPFTKELKGFQYTHDENGKPYFTDLNFGIENKKESEEKINESK